jgi:hypothetical protein
MKVELVWHFKENIILEIALNLTAGRSQTLFSDAEVET